MSVSVKTCPCFVGPGSSDAVPVGGAVGLFLRVEGEEDGVVAQGDIFRLGHKKGRLRDGAPCLNFVYHTVKFLSCKAPDTARSVPPFSQARDLPSPVGRYGSGLSGYAQVA